MPDSILNKIICIIGIDIGFYLGGVGTDSKFVRFNRVSLELTPTYLFSII